MANPVRLSSEPDAPPDQVARIADLINAWNMEVTGDRAYHPIGIFLRDGEDAIRGGITGGVWGGWLHVEALWVDEALRGHGFGRELLLAAETEAIAVGARHAFLETHTFQAPGLYERMGYVVAGELVDYPPGERQLLFRKDLG